MQNFKTIREVAETGIISDYALRLMLKSDNPPPHIVINKKVLINYPLFMEWLDNESKRATVFNKL